MSERDVEVVQALLHELIEIVAEKPALAKRLVEAIEYRLVNVALDPLLLYQKAGSELLRKKLRELGADALRILVKQHNIPCQNVGKRKKAELIDIVERYASNTDIGEVDAAA